MPRLRYKKSYDFTLYEQADERDVEEGGEEEYPSGNSWLSNAAIAGQLSEDKIRKAISALKAQITILEAELLSRRFARSNEANSIWDQIGNLRGPENGERLYPRTNRTPTKRRKAAQVHFAKLSKIRQTLKNLGVIDVDKLLAEWSKINEKEK